MRVLFVCTANICRSPLASALMVKSAQVHGASSVRAASAGFLEGGRPVHDHVLELLDERGIDASRKRSRKLDHDIIAGADLVLAMTSEHARGVVARNADSIKRVYAMRHFGQIVTPRPASMEIGRWLDGIYNSSRPSYLHDDDELDIPDPIGEPIEVYRRLATEFETTLNWIMGCANLAGSLDAETV